MHVVTSDLHKIETIMVAITPDSLRRIANALEHKALVVKPGDSSVAATVEGNKMILQFCVGGNYKGFDLRDDRISVIRDADAFEAAIYRGEKQWSTANGISVEEAIANLKEKTQ